MRRQMRRQIQRPMPRLASMCTHAILFTSLFGLVGCTAPAVRETPPACLNVQEGDRHVEFDGRNLRLAETGEPKTLVIETGEGVRCERLEILRNAPVASVLIQYSTNGVSKSGTASIKDAKWIETPKPK